MFFFEHSARLDLEVRGVPIDAACGWLEGVGLFPKQQVGALVQLDKVKSNRVERFKPRHPEHFAFSQKFDKHEL